MKIGETLKQVGLLTDDELNRALDEQKITHDRLGDIVLKMGFATPESMAPALANYFRIPFVNLKDFYKTLSSELIDTVSFELATRFNIIPIEIKNNTLIVATFDPLNLLAIDTLRMKTGFKIECVIAAEDDIKEAIDYCYNNLPRMRQHINKFIDTELVDAEDQNGRIKDQQPIDLKFGAGDQPVVQFVRSLIVQAVNNRASDILLQPKQEKAELRFRIDGVLHQIDPPPLEMLSAINTRIKILACLDIAEKRLPQDGRFKINISGHEVDLRVSSFPTIYGESVVMRLLDTSAPLLGMPNLGMMESDLVKFRAMLSKPYGLILVTGPTGSGKTTTLYTCLNEIKSEAKNIITLEDPVEYRLPFIQQSQVNPGIGFDFARGLRSILRQDPDVIMVGEIRDQETAEIAIHAALTGHLVFSTLHTNDASGAPVRLAKMGVEPFLITSSLLGVVAQRLIRLICDECREPYEVDQNTWKKFGLNSNGHKLFHGRGCPKCMNSGYMGRKGIYELLLPTDEIRKLMLDGRSSEEIRQAAQKSGMKTLRQIGMEYLKRGKTTPEEILRVTQETEEL
ncbi:MAG: GspE/PulE family protein [Candidatus Omnitrophota bacterium]